ncbi:MAG: antitoxin VbhA family protein [Candidatus Methylumidiphilus sp.]
MRKSDRTCDVKNAIAQQRFEGLMPSREVVSDLERAAYGEITVSEVIANLGKRHREEHPEQETQRMRSGIAFCLPLHPSMQPCFPASIAWTTRNPGGRGRGLGGRTKSPAV